MGGAARAAAAAAVGERGTAVRRGAISGRSLRGLIKERPKRGPGRRGGGIN